jgi:hypothetical protein
MLASNNFEATRMKQLRHRLLMHLPVQRCGRHD